MGIIEEIKMETIKIKIKSKLINYNLEFEHNLNIIRGDSATGKSTLVRFLDNEESSCATIESNYELFHLTAKMLERNIRLDERTVYIMDESDGIKNKIVIDTINKNKYNFILIIRDTKLENLSYGISQIYEIFRSGKYNLNRRMYNENLNKDKSIEYDKLDSIITEDSGSGYEYYTTYRNFNVSSSNGNSNINKYLNLNQIVVIDEIAFGPYIKTLEEKSTNSNIFILYPKTFEWLILTSKIFRISDRSLENGYKTGEYAINREKYYENVLKNESNKINLKYSKSKLSEEFKEAKQLDKINERLVELFKIDIKELSENRQGNAQIKWRWK